MALILQIETSTSACSVALAENGKVLTVKERVEPNIHASQITLFIHEVMKNVSAEYSDLSAVAVSKGPGSYTGLRIGVSTAKGLSYALDIPLISVDTLYAMASGFLKYADVETAGDSLLCPMIDARRMEVYMALYNNKLLVIEPVQAKVLELDSFDNYLDKQILFFGDGAFKTTNIYSGHLNMLFTEFHNSASYLTDPVYDKYLQQDFEDVAYFEPFYLKDFIAGKAKKI